MHLEKASQVLDALGSYVSDLSETVNSEGDWAMASCPMAPWEHGSGGRDKNPSFAINVEPGPSWCKCYSCDFSGPLAEAIRRVHRHGGIDDETAEKLLLFARTETKRDFHIATSTYTPDLPAFLKPYFNRPHPYIYERGFDDEDIAKWHLGYSDDVERMLIPFYDADGTLVSVLGRDVTGKQQPKYMIYPRGFPRGRYLFGENHLREGMKTLLVVEGYLDAVSASKHLPEGVGVVAIGTAIPTDHQLRKVVSYAPEVCLGLDNPDKDTAGAKGLAKAKNFLAGRCKLSQIDYGEFKDANEAGANLTTIFENRQGNVLVNPLMNMLKEMRSRA